MSRVSKIRWNDANHQELKRVVRNFNAKVKRLEKKNPELKNVLPDKVSVAQMKELIETRNDLKRELNSLKRFSQKGAEKLVDVPGNDYNLKTTNWQKKEMSRRIGVINRKRKKRLNDLENIEMTSGGKPLGYKKSDIGMGSAESNSLKPMNAFTPKMTRGDLNKKFEAIKNESKEMYWDKRDLGLIDSYISSLEDNLNANDIKDIVDHINKMDVKEFKKIFYAEGGHELFDFSYPKTEEEKRQYTEHLKSIWMPNKKPTTNKKGRKRKGV